MSRILHAARYGAVRPTEITSELAPPAVVDAATLLAKSVDTRIRAEEAWRNAKDALDYETETIAERIARATVTGENVPADQTEKLDTALKAAAVQRDAAGKVCKEYELALAAVIGSERDEWVGTLTDEIERRGAAVEAACAAIEGELATIDRLQATRKIANDTQSGGLARFRGGSWTSDARAGLREIRK